MRSSPESEEDVQNRRTVAAKLAIGVGASVVMAVLGSGPLERRPELPLESAKLAALAALHNQVPEANKTDGLTALSEDRTELFEGLSCRDGSAAFDLSRWYHRDVRTGSSEMPFRRELTWKTRFKCGAREWKMEGENDDLELTTDRGWWGRDWVYQVDSFVDSSPEATVSKNLASGQ